MSTLLHTNHLQTEGVLLKQYSEIKIMLQLIVFVNLETDNKLIEKLVTQSILHHYGIRKISHLCMIGMMSPLESLTKDCLLEVILENNARD